MSAAFICRFPVPELTNIYKSTRRDVVIVTGNPYNEDVEIF